MYLHLCKSFPADTLFIQLISLYNTWPNPVHCQLQRYNICHNLTCQCFQCWSVSANLLSVIAISSKLFLIFMFCRPTNKLELWEQLKILSKFLLLIIFFEYWSLLFIASFHLCCMNWVVTVLMEYPSAYCCLVFRIPWWIVNCPKFYFRGYRYFFYVYRSIRLVALFYTFMF